MGSAIASDTQATHIPASAELTMKRRRRRRQEEEETRQDKTQLWGADPRVNTSRAKSWPLSGPCRQLHTASSLFGHGRVLGPRPALRRAQANALEGGGGTANTHRLMANLGPNQHCTNNYLDSGLVFAEEEEEKEEEEQRTKDACLYVCANHNTM